jgi:hypothetical protein
VTPENNLYADQKYLEHLQTMWPTETFIAEFGLNFSTWSLAQDQEISRTKETIYISNYPVLSFHFHSLKHSEFFTYLGINRYGRILSHKKIREEIYYPYVRSLYRNRIEVKLQLGSSTRIENRILPSGIGIKILVRGLLNGDIVFNRLLRG